MAFVVRRARKRKKVSGMQIGQLFRAQRLRLSLSQAELAQRAGLDVTVIRRLEAGQPIEDAQIAALADKLGISMQDAAAALRETQAARAQEEAYEQRAAAQSELPRMRLAAPQQDAPRRGYDGLDEANAAMPSAEEEARLQEIRRQRRRRAYEGTLGERRRASFSAQRTAPIERVKQEVPPTAAEPAARLEEKIEEPVRETPRVRETAAQYAQMPRTEVPTPQEAPREERRVPDDMPLRPVTETQTEAPRRTMDEPLRANRAPRREETPVRMRTGAAYTYEQMLSMTADVAQLSGRETVLEIGCGKGELTRVLAARSRFVAAMDSSVRALEQNRAACGALGIGNVDFLEGDARRLPIESGSFDVVFVPMLLHHVVSPAQVLVEACRVLKPGGIVVVTELMPGEEPAQQSIQNAVEVLKNPTHIGVIPMQEVTRMMQYAHLDIVDRRVFDQTWEFSEWVDAMGARDRMEPLRALMRSFALQGNRAGMDLCVDDEGRMTFTYRWMFFVGLKAR